MDEDKFADLLLDITKFTDFSIELVNKWGSMGGTDSGCSREQLAILDVQSARLADAMIKCSEKQ